MRSATCNSWKRPDTEIWQIFYLRSEKYLKTLSDRQINALLYEIGIAESNDDVRILIGSSEIAEVCSCAVQIWPKVLIHADYTLTECLKSLGNCWLCRVASCGARNKARNEWRGVVGFKLQCIAVVIFLVFDHFLWPNISSVQIVLFSCPWTSPYWSLTQFRRHQYHHHFRRPFPTWLLQLTVL